MSDHTIMIILVMKIFLYSILCILATSSQYLLLLLGLYHFCPLSNPSLHEMFLWSEIPYLIVFTIWKAGGKVQRKLNIIESDLVTCNLTVHLTSGKSKEELRETTACSGRESHLHVLTSSQDSTFTSPVQS